jgi:hypothetical protein
MTNPTLTSDSIDLLNEIPKIQNEEGALQLLAAQRQLYARAKRLLGWQLLLGGPIAALVALLGIFEPGAKVFVAAWGLSILVLDTLYLGPYQRRLRETGARVQERFDCHVLGLRWDTTKVGHPEPVELVHEQAQRYQTWASKMPPLADWYPRAVQRLPLPLARIVCQRTNCWWDAKQRRYYATVMAGLLVTGILLVFWIGVAAGFHLSEVLVIVALPMSTTLILAHRQWIDHREAADRLDRLREHAERVWRHAISNPEDPNLEHEARSLQGEIFDGRKRNPPVFDFVFKWLRSSNESQMNVGAAHYVAEAELSVGAPRTHA